MSKARSPSRSRAMKSKIVADVTGLTPGKHGFHIHQFGDCSSPDGNAAGGHFNPTKAPHAGHDAAQRHVGDLGNLEADASGKAHLELTDNMMTMSGEKSIIGRGVIVHEKEDDLKSQPVGNAGGRLAWWSDRDRQALATSRRHECGARKRVPLE